MIINNSKICSIISNQTTYFVILVGDNFQFYIIY